MSCGAETEANTLYGVLTTDSAAIPAINLDDPLLQIPSALTDDIYKKVVRVTNEDLTTGSVDGTGTFDVLMRGFKSHLTKEFKDGRIIGAEYTKAYIALTESAMQQAVQFLLGREQSFWASAAGQVAVINAKVELAATRVKAAALMIDAQTGKATYALTKMKLSSESMQYCTGKYQLDTYLPLQTAMLTSQKTGQDKQNEILLYQHAYMLPKQLGLVTEQFETQRAQTMNHRSDGGTVEGVIQKNKDLLEQQKISYQRDSEIKAARPFIDAWITMKTVDEGLNAPNGFTNASLDTILAKLKTNNGLN